MIIYSKAMLAEFASFKRAKRLRALKFAGRGLVLFIGFGFWLYFCCECAALLTE